MRALVWEGPKVMAMREWPDPSPAPGEVVIEVAFAGICGSELGGYLGHNALRVPPLVMGHEFSGTVAAVGENVTNFSVGDRVTCNPMVPCGECAYCDERLPHLCLRRSLVGAHRPGAYAQYVAAPARAVFRLPDAMSMQDGAMVEPVAVAVRIGTLAGDVSGRKVLVIGAGPIGLLAVQVLAAAGADEVFCADLDPERLAMAVSLGATPIDPRKEASAAVLKAATGGLGAWLTVDAVGSGQTRTEAVAATRSAGRVLLSGLHAEASDFPGSDVIRREIEVKGAFCYTAEDFAEALGAVAEGRLTLRPWVREAALDTGGDWFERLVTSPGDVSKVLLVPGSPS